MGRKDKMKKERGSQIRLEAFRAEIKLGKSFRVTSFKRDITLPPSLKSWFNLCSWESLRLINLKYISLYGFSRPAAISLELLRHNKIPEAELSD